MTLHGPFGYGRPSCALLRDVYSHLHSGFVLHYHCTHLVRPVQLWFNTEYRETDTFPAKRITGFQNGNLDIESHICLFKSIATKDTNSTENALHVYCLE